MRAGLGFQGSDKLIHTVNFFRPKPRNEVRRVLLVNADRMQVRVVESRSHCHAFEVDDFYAGHCQAADLRRASDRGEMPVRYSKGLGARMGGVDGHDVAVDVDGIAAGRGERA